MNDLRNKRYNTSISCCIVVGIFEFSSSRRSRVPGFPHVYDDDCVTDWSDDQQSQIQPQPAALLVNHRINMQMARTHHHKRVCWGTCIVRCPLTQGTKLTISPAYKHKTALPVLLCVQFNNPVSVQSRSPLCILCSGLPPLLASYHSTNLHTYSTTYIRRTSQPATHTTRSIQEIKNY